ncbi:MAG: CapA family protein [bacterium]
MKVIQLSSALVLCLLIISSGRIAQSGQSGPGTGRDSISTIRISFVGDIMCHMPQVNNAQIGTDSFDFTPSFTPVKAWFESDDLTIGNFETTCAGREIGYSGYPLFNTPDGFVTALKESGFDLLLTANNHAMDQGVAGMVRTLGVIREHGLGYTGAFKSTADRDSARIYKIRGIRIAVLNYTYGSNQGFPADSAGFLNRIDTLRIRQEIGKAHADSVDLVILCFHFGEEMNREATPYQDSVVQASIRAGADLIIGSHPHMIGPVSFFKTNEGRLDTGFVAFSLGNFISNQYWRYTDAGVILQVEFAKVSLSRDIRLSGIRYLPTWVYRGTNPQREMHIVYPAEMAVMDTNLIWLEPDSRKTAREAFKDTRSKLGLPGLSIILYRSSVAPNDTVP